MSHFRERFHQERLAKSLHTIARLAPLPFFLLAALLVRFLPLCQIVSHGDVLSRTMVIAWLPMAHHKQFD